MAKKILSHYDFTRNQIQNAVLHLLAAAPASPTAGVNYFNTTSNKYLWHDGTNWIDPLDRAAHSGTQLAATISDFNTAVRLNRLDQMAAPTAAVSLNSQRITNLAEPTTGTDAATRNFVESLVNGTDWKNSVRIATTANITLSGLQTIDAVSGAVDDRVLVKNQTTGSENGLYLMKSGAWVRTTDADTSAEVTANLSVFVEEGATLADSQWRLTTNNPIVLGTTALTFGQIGSGSSYTGGTGISVAGNVISLDTAVAVRKYAADVGGSTSQVITHGLGTLDVVVQVYEISTGDTVECDVKRNSTSQVTLGFTVAPGAASLRVVVHA